jgi:branched-chain amino acid aminotransferase
MRDAQARGFDNAAMLDSAGNITEFASANLFLVSAAGAVVTPVANGTFLAGITRARVIALLGEAGVQVERRTVTLARDRYFAYMEQQ